MNRNEHIIEEIKSKGDIIDIISGYVNLKKTGANYKGCCPFHNEKTPSFIVSENKQIFTCFGCGETGDLIKFVQKIENLSFHETIEKLADRLGIQIDASQFQTEKNKDKFYEINRQAALIFYDNLQNKSSKGAAYVTQRGLSPATIKRFGLGYAEDSWDNLMNLLLAKDITEKDLLDLGLISKSATGKTFDKFRNRLMFPIINTRGKLIGFGGRAIGDESPKYLNSPDTVVFSKKNNLYGLNLTRKEINIRNCVILVEGYMDVISLYQYGVKNTVASLGTALTSAQASMIKRYADHVVIAYDADTAGQAAALRAIDILYAAGCSIKVLHLPDVKDPDEFVVRHGAAAFYELVDKAATFIEFKVALAKEKYDRGTTSGNVSFLKEVSSILKSLKSPIEADFYIEKIAADSKISAGAIRNEIYGGKELPRVSNFSPPSQPYERPEDRSPAAGQPARKKNSPAAARDFLEKNLIRLMLASAAFVPQVEGRENVFQNPIYQRIFDVITSLYTDEQEIDLEKLKDNLTDEENRALDQIFQNIVPPNQKEDIFFKDCMDKLEKEKLKVREKEILDVLTVLDEENNQEQIRNLTKELVEMRNR